MATFNLQNIHDNSQKQNLYAEQKLCTEDILGVRFYEAFQQLASKSLKYVGIFSRNSGFHPKKQYLDTNIQTRFI